MSFKQLGSFMKAAIVSEYNKIRREAYRIDAKFQASIEPLIAEAKRISLSKVEQPLKKNLDLNEGWTKIVDDAREEGTDYIIDNLINPIEDAAYCDSKRNKDYWKQMGDSDAAKDFVKYIKKVKCK